MKKIRLHLGTLVVTHVLVAVFLFLNVFPREYGITGFPIPIYELEDINDESKKQKYTVSEVGRDMQYLIGYPVNFVFSIAIVIVTAYLMESYSKGDKSQ